MVGCLGGCCGWFGSTSLWLFNSVVTWLFFWYLVFAVGFAIWLVCLLRFSFGFACFCLCVLGCLGVSDLCVDLLFVV